MGDLLFHVPQAGAYDPRIWDSAYITGIEGIAWHCHHQLQGEQFSIGRQIDESGKLNIVWPSSTIGNVCLSTTSLRISPTAYTLGLELARGTVNRLRSQASDWHRIGLKLPDGFYPLAEESLSQLLRGLTAVGNRQAQRVHAKSAIDLALKASLELCDAYSTQALDARRQNEGRLATLLGIELENTPVPTGLKEVLSASFNLISVPADLGSVETSSGKSDFEPFDQQVDWAHGQGKKICLGPLVNFRKGRLPKWMVLLNEGFENIREAACKHAGECVQRYRGRVHIWNCAAGLNGKSEMGWSDEEALRMAVSLIETVRRGDDRCPVLLTIDQPWSEYLRQDADGISPLHFADALIRADLGLSGLALDLRFGGADDESFPRDPIEISRLIDRWAMLGLPLMVSLSSPVSAAPPNAGRITGWTAPEESAGSVAPETIIKLLMSKPCVHAVIWNQLRDPAGTEHEYSGLCQHDAKLKPILRNLRELRQNYLH